MATKMKCPNGQAWDTKLKKCVELDDPMQNLYGYSTKGGINWYGEDSPSTIVRGSKPMIRGARETAQKMAEILKKKSKMGGATYKTGGRVAKKKKYGEGGPTTKSNTTPMEQSSQPNTPPVGTNKLTGNPRFKTGGMVNANANLKATATASSKGVKSGVNPKAAASKVAKKPSASRSKAPKKATPGRK